MKGEKFSGNYYMCKDDNSIVIEDKIVENSWKGIKTFCAEGRIMLEVLDILIKYISYDI